METTELKNKVIFSLKERKEVEEKSYSLKIVCLRVLKCLGKRKIKLGKR